MDFSLNIGCGEQIVSREKTMVNLDLRKTSLTHVIANAEKPLPFRDRTFQTIYALDIIEHLDNVVRVIDEFHRITRPLGSLMLRTAAWDAEQSYTDPTHRHWFTLESFDFFDPETKWGNKYGWYTRRKWKIAKRERRYSELLFVMLRRFE